jgi:hypothetical protein
MATAELVVKVGYPFSHGNDHVHFGHSHPLCPTFLDGFHSANNIWPVGHGEGDRKDTGT